ncbi:Pentatricopeptide repeat-containing protein [Actinidia chinensis var. chinensis]|uniref:Pentatricopeptide repeat-containing protein n=1 Tax=Actinidia chinensis var. chinensis TaxID=1590841 RepID=A0A2R6PJA5_ACTCC|nr:Pentatricopeptide repeat-containing protein [Actinidia chinensis var. chinensis]
MSELGIPVSPYALSVMLCYLVYSNRIDNILDVYGEMGDGLREEKSRCINVYDFVINDFFATQRVRLKWLNFHLAMIERRSVVDSVACPKPSLVTFSTLISGYCKELRLEKAFDLYNLMRTMGIDPDLIIYSILIDGLFRVGKFEEGNRLLSAALDRGGFWFRNQWGRLLEACGIFSQIMKRGIEPSVCTYSSLIDGVCKWGNLKGKFDLYMDMVNKGHTPDVAVYCLLITALSKQGRGGFAVKFFNKSVKRGRMDDVIFLLSTMLGKGLEPNMVTSGCLIDGYFKTYNMQNAFELYEEMLWNNITPNIVSYSILIDGLCKRGLVGEVSAAFDHDSNQNSLPDLVANGILIRGYCKVGRLADAMMFYNRMLEDGILLDSFLQNCTLRISSSRR